MQGFANGSNTLHYAPLRDLEKLEYEDASYKWRDGPTMRTYISQLKAFVMYAWSCVHLSEDGAAERATDERAALRQLLEQAADMLAKQVRHAQEVLS